MDIAMAMYHVAASAGLYLSTNAGRLHLSEEIPHRDEEKRQWLKT